LEFRVRGLWVGARGRTHLRPEGVRACGLEFLLESRVVDRQLRLQRFQNLRCTRPVVVGGGRRRRGRGGHRGRGKGTKGRRDGGSSAGARERDKIKDYRVRDKIRAIAKGRETRLGISRGDAERCL
jgi:hypothetical protein